MDPSEQSTPHKSQTGKKDVVDEAEYARALRATMHIKSPDRSRSGSAQLFGGQNNEDAELARAIAASLQDVSVGSTSGSNNQRKRAEVVELTEDEMMAMAIAESESMARQSANRRQASSFTGTSSVKGKGKISEVVIIDDSDTEEEQEIARKRPNPQPSGQTKQQPVSTIPDVTPAPRPAVLETNPAAAPTAQAATNPSFPFDRLALERERLERQKRLRGDVNAPASSSDDEEESQEKGGKKDDGEDERDPKRRKLDGGTTSEAATNTKTPAVRAPFRNAEASTSGTDRTSRPSTSTQGNVELFPEGEVRPTWNQYARDDRKRFRIQDVLGNKEDLALVITASFCHESEWINDTFPDPVLVPTIHIRQPGGVAENERWTMETEETGGGLPGSATVWCFMPSPGLRGTMHMKFMLLFHKTGRLRVVISSANLVSYDWESIENIVFVQDFDRVKSVKNPTVVTEDMPAKFQRLFDRYMKIERALNHLSQFHPFGAEIPLDVRSNGQRSLATFGQWDWSRVTAELVMSVPGKDIGESSSLTNFTPRFMRNFYDCMKGMSAAAASRVAINKDTPYPPIKVLFPSLRTVVNSERGPPGAGTMFCTDKHWTPKTKDLFYDANCKAAKVMMHTKCIIATFRPKGATGNTLHRQFSSNASSGTASGARSIVGGWYYIGSHNFSSAAWGTMNTDNGQPQIYVQNYEMGIVLPLPVEDTDKAATEFATWQRPPRKYNSDNDKPWMQTQFRALCEQGPEALNAEVTRYAL